MSHNIFIPYSNSRVWHEESGTMGILNRIKGNPRHRLTDDFETWCVDNLVSVDWGLVNVDRGVEFQFEHHRDATLFKLTWA